MLFFYVPYVGLHEHSLITINHFPAAPPRPVAGEAERARTHAHPKKKKKKKIPLPRAHRPFSWY